MRHVRLRRQSIGSALAYFMRLTEAVHRYFKMLEEAVNRRVLAYDSLLMGRERRRPHCARLLYESLLQEAVYRLQLLVHVI